MQDNGELAGDGYDRSVQPAPLGDGYAPGLQHAPASLAGQQGQRGLHQRSAHSAVAGLGDRAAVVDLPGGIFTWDQTEMRADVSGVGEPCGSSMPVT
jgi:hypothetical protein